VYSSKRKDSLRVPWYLRGWSACFYLNRLSSCALPEKSPPRVSPEKLFFLFSGTSNQWFAVRFTEPVTSRAA